MIRGSHSVPAEKVSSFPTNPFPPTSYVRDSHQATISTPILVWAALVFWLSSPVVGLSPHLSWNQHHHPRLKSLSRSRRPRPYSPSLVGTFGPGKTLLPMRKLVLALTRIDVNGLFDYSQCPDLLWRMQSCASYATLGEWDEDSRSERIGVRREWSGQVEADDSSESRVREAWMELRSPSESVGVLIGSKDAGLDSSVGGRCCPVGGGAIWQLPALLDVDGKVEIGDNFVGWTIVFWINVTIWVITA